jgi:hypothetical protein
MNAGHIRDRADRRVRRFTAAAIAGATALTGIFAGIAAGSTHTAKKSTQRVARTTAATTETVTAPTPTLVPNGSSAQTPAATTTTAVQAPAPAYSAPVVVSGGS